MGRVYYFSFIWFPKLGLLFGKNIYCHLSFFYLLFAVSYLCYIRRLISLWDSVLLMRLIRYCTSSSRPSLCHVVKLFSKLSCLWKEEWHCENNKISFSLQKKSSSKNFLTAAYFVFWEAHWFYMCNHSFKHMHHQ